MQNFTCQQCHRNVPEQLKQMHNNRLCWLKLNQVAANQIERIILENIAKKTLSAPLEVLKPQQDIDHPGVLLR